MKKSIIGQYINNSRPTDNLSLYLCKQSIIKNVKKKSTDTKYPNYRTSHMLREKKPKTFKFVY